MKLNSTTVRGSSVMLFGEKVSVPDGATSTCSVRVPPTGRPSGGKVLGVFTAVARFLKASNVLPEVGLVGFYRVSK